MKATNEQTAQIVIDELGEVPPLVHEITDKATTQARDFFERREEQINSYLFPCLVRYFAKILLESPKYKAAGYSLVDLSNNGLFLVYSKDGRTRKIRILKADEGELPVMNLSRTKKQFFRNSTPFFPEWSDMEGFVLPSSLNLVALWDVDVNHVLTGVQLVCPNGEFGDVHFVGDILHSATAIIVEESFDDVADELDIDITPLRKTGSETE